LSTWGGAGWQQGQLACCGRGLAGGTDVPCGAHAAPCVCVVCQRYHRGGRRVGGNCVHLALCCCALGFCTPSCLFTCECIHCFASHASFSCLGCGMIVYIAAPAVRGPWVFRTLPAIPAPSFDAAMKCGVVVHWLMTDAAWPAGPLMVVRLADSTSAELTLLLLPVPWSMA
jgi:hypothetical protein